MFIGEITDMEVLSNIPSVTYDYYQNNIKPENVGKTEDGQYGVAEFVDMNM